MSWLTPLLQPALPLRLASVLSRDIKVENEVAKYVWYCNSCFVYCRQDNLEVLISAVVQWLLRAGATVDKTDGGGNLALHHAAQGGIHILVEINVSFILIFGS